MLQRDRTMDLTGRSFAMGIRHQHLRYNRKDFRKPLLICVFKVCCFACGDYSTKNNIAIKFLWCFTPLISSTTRGTCTYFFTGFSFADLSITKTHHITQHPASVHPSFHPSICLQRWPKLKSLVLGSHIRPMDTLGEYYKAYQELGHCILWILWVKAEFSQL